MIVYALFGTSVCTFASFHFIFIKNEGGDWSLNIDAAHVKPTQTLNG